MKILIVGVVTNWQFARLREEAEKRGHQIDACYSAELMLFASPDKFEPRLRGSDIFQYDLIYLWAVAKRRWEWFCSCYFLNKTKGTRIVNFKVIDAKYNYFLTPAIDYLTQKENDLPFPKSWIVCSTNSLVSLFENQNYPLIVKPTEGRQGRLVFKVENPAELKKRVGEILKAGSGVVVREFIPNAGDIRVFTVGYKAIGAMVRIPKEGDFRSNISQGATAKSFDLDKYSEIRDLAEKASRITRTEIAGVDIIRHKQTGKPYILEINPGPQFTGFEKYTGVNAAGLIIDYFEKLQRGKVTA